MGATPEGPRDDGGGFDLALRQARGDPADFLYRPADQRRLLRIIVRLLFGGAEVLALWRMAASIAKASMTSETCRCQPCRERVSLWSRPNSFLAVSKPSSMAQRRPSTATRVSIPVPAGHQVAKKASSPLARLRRIRKPLVPGATHEKPKRLLLDSGVMAAGHMTKAATRAPRRALPRRRALCTNSKKPRYSGSFSCEMPRCGRSQERSKDHVPSIVLTWISQKPSPSSSRAYSPRAWQTVLC